MWQVRGTLWVTLVLAPWTAAWCLSAVLLSPFDREGRIYHWIARGWAKSTLFLSGVRVSVKLSPRLDPGRSYVFVSNHASIYDIPLVIDAIPYPIRLVVKKELAAVPFLGWNLRTGDYILIDRGNLESSKQCLEEAVHKIQSGRSMQLFAEGTRSPTGEVMPFKRGSFYLALQSGVPIVPVTINNSYRIVRNGGYRVHPTRVEIILDDPIDTSGHTIANLSELIDKVRDVVVKNHRM